jgi:hypothetical protein
MLLLLLLMMMMMMGESDSGHKSSLPHHLNRIHI